MALVSMSSVLLPAKKNGYAIGAFEFWSFDSAIAIVSAAEELKIPVILQAGPLECIHTGIENLAFIAKSVAAKASVDVVLHLDHGDSVVLAKEAIACGFTSVMIDSSDLPLAENIAVTKEVVELARPKHVDVEGEIGILGGSEGGKDVLDSLMTDPDEALRFVRETGINALAVAVGTAHGVYIETPNLDFERLNAIQKLVDMPIVLHGGSGVPEEQVRKSIQYGVCKVNICTEFLIAMGSAFTKTQAKPGFKYSVPTLFEPARAAGKELALAKMKMLK